MLLSMVRKNDSFLSCFINALFLYFLELHVYNGLFGTHVAFIMRRLTRLCRYYNNENIKFISCSATIEQPDKVKIIFFFFL